MKGHAMSKGWVEEIYPEFVEGILAQLGSQKQDLAHVAMGIAGEAGEILDTVKKHFAYGQELNVENIREELGDLEFYMQAMRSLLELDRDKIVWENIEKLRKRYPKGRFCTEDSIARADKLPEKPF
jgi:NTP pyrophosphatase (non-canonical NTP hydrolase)